MPSPRGRHSSSLYPMHPHLAFCRMCLVFAKSGVELLLVSINGNNQFWQWQAWMLIFGLVAFALLQLWYLHKALKLADPTIVCPREFCLPSHPFSTNAFHL